MAKAFSLKIFSSLLDHRRNAVNDVDGSSKSIFARLFLV